MIFDKKLSGLNFDIVQKHISSPNGSASINVKRNRNSAVTKPLPSFRHTSAKRAIKYVYPILFESVCIETYVILLCELCKCSVRILCLKELVKLSLEIASLAKSDSEDLVAIACAVKDLKILV